MNILSQVSLRGQRGFLWIKLPKKCMDIFTKSILVLTRKSELLYFFTHTLAEKNHLTVQTPQMCGKSIDFSPYVPTCILQLWNVSPWLQNLMFEPIVHLIFISVMSKSLLSWSNMSTSDTKVVWLNCRIIFVVSTC